MPKKRQLSTQIPEVFFVLLCEEFGFAHWFWIPKLSASALADWWRHVEAAEVGKAPLFFNTRNLPGKRILADETLFYELYNTGKYWYAHAHWEDDSYLLSPDKTVIYHQGYPK